MLRPLMLAAALSVSAQVGAQELQPVPELDLERYAGVWHEIARLPNRFEDQCVADITATYTPMGDGKIRVVNACVNEDGKTEAVEGEARLAGEHPAKLEVRFAPKWLSFLPFVWGDYWVIALDEDYRWSIVGEPGRDYLWFLTREPSVDAETFESLKSRARELGYNLDELEVITPPRDA